MWWDLVGDRAVFYNDETFLGKFAHNKIEFMDGAGNPYDWSSWQYGDFELPTEIAFSTLDLNAWGGRFSAADIHLHAVPLPAAVWLFGAGLVGLLNVGRRKNRLLNT